MDRVDNLVSLMLEAIDEEVVEAFCIGCPHQEYFPASFMRPEEWTCSGDFCPADPGCGRHDLYRKMEEKAKEVIAILGEAEEENVHLSRVRED